MSIGAYILTQSGDGNVFSGLAADLSCAVTEIRVEQNFTTRSTFAIRFQEDFEDGEAATITASQLRGSKGMAIVVSAGPGQPPEGGGGLPSIESEQLMCLLRGQVENSEADVSIGATGSWYEVRGRDVRTLIDRCSDGYQIPGNNEEIAKGMTAEFTTGDWIAGDPVATFPEDQPFAFSGTILQGLERLSKLCNYPVWLRYPVARSAIAMNRLGQENFDIVVDTYFCASPERGENAKKTPVPEINLLGIDEGKHAAYLRIIGDDKQCENVVNFSLKTDNEAISSVSASVVDEVTGEAKDFDGQKANDEALGEETVDTTGAEAEGEDCKRSTQITKVGKSDIVVSTAQAAANDASWYVKAQALTTVHMLGKVLQPHDLVKVIGGGCGINGIFQVEKVTHVINAAAHWMHLDLRSNSRSLGPAKEDIFDGQ